MEFNANVEGDWFFTVIFSPYDEWYGQRCYFLAKNQAPNPLITTNPKLAQRKLFADDRKFHFMADNDFAGNRWRRIKINQLVGDK